MNLANLTTLFTTPLSSAAYTQSIGFRSSDIRTFQNNEIVRPQDSFISNPIYPNLDDAESIKRIAKSNPRIMQLLKENGVKLKVNMDELAALKKGHLNDTRVITAKICSNLSSELKQQVNMSDIQQAAMLHDYGKVLIPKEILNKKGSLDPNERKIMNLHSELGYELLKNQGINQNVLNMIKYHHQRADKGGYPSAGEDFNYNIGLEIVEMADMYSALTEERSYHKAYSHEEALAKIQERVEAGYFSQEVFEALKKIQ